MRKTFILFLSLVAFNAINAQCIQSLSAGEWSSFVVKSNGMLYGWGQRGIGSSSGGYVGSAIPINMRNDTDWEAVSVGGAFAIAKKNNGTLWNCSLHALGNYSTNYLYQIGTDTDWDTFKVGGYHTLAIKTNGTLWAWGNNGFFQLGNGNNLDQTNPVQIGTDTSWQKIFPGSYHNLAIKADGSLWAWGQGDYGQMGDWNVSDRNTPVQAGTTNDWATAAAGSSYSFGIKTNGTLWAWGRNNNGQLGLGNLDSKNTPTQVGTATNWSTVVSYGNEYNSTSNTGYTIALKTDGTLWAWGQNNNSVTLISNTVYYDIISPIQIGTANDWQKIYAGVKHILAMKNDGTVWTWGENYAGQLGNGSGGGQTFTPQLVDCAAWLNTEELTNEENNLYVYPNPIKDRVIIKGLAFESPYQIMNALGQIIQKGVAIPNSEILINSFAKGIYYLKINQQTIKLIKE